MSSTPLLTPPSHKSPSPSTPLAFSHILGQGKVNQLGGVYINGRPLPPSVRLQIIQMAASGVRPCQISRQLRVSHGAVSKILNRYAENGSIFPGQMGGTRGRQSAQSLEESLSALLDLHPDASPLQLQSLLVAEESCTRSSAPSVSSIGRFLRSRPLRSLQPQRKRLSHSIDSILGTSSDDSKSSPSSDEDNYTETRRNRTNFSADQVTALEAAFKENSYPDPAARELLSRETGLNDDKIMTWFSNRRARCRKSLPFLQQLLLSGDSPPESRVLPLGPLLLHPAFLLSPVQSPSL